MLKLKARKERKERTALREASAHRVLETPAARDGRCAPIPTAGRRKWPCLRAGRPRDRPASAPGACRASRSEERRVGKECRSRRVRDDCKKKRLSCTSCAE